MRYKCIKLIFIIFFLIHSGVHGQSTKHWEEELSGAGWHLWLDRSALWYNDTVFLPPVDVSKLPFNAPTCGWNNLESQEQSINVTVPGTVEEYYWGEIGGAIPDTGGNYVGVSWWSRKFNIDSKLKGKRITIHFESVNLRAEIFVNGKLVGYDVIGNTPFDVDATEAVRFGEENRLDIRITDPVGNFSWDDNILMRWGNNLVPAVHGFGGITGKILLQARDATFIEDIYVQNQKNPKNIKLIITVNNQLSVEKKGEISVALRERGKDASVVYEEKIKVKIPASGSKIFTITAKVPKAKLWELSGYKSNQVANLYVAEVEYSSDDKKEVDNREQIFGFRWFDVGEKDGDKRFYLNGKRIVLLTAMSRGFWPKNGIFPTQEMLERDVATMKNLGLNTMYMHRAIGQPEVMQYADSVGMLTYEEPGGYRLMPNKRDDISEADEQSRLWRKEKLRRMIIRDRSHPASIIYYLKNEAVEKPDDDDIANINMVKSLDPSRAVMYNSGSSIGTDPQLESPTDPVKLHSLAYSDKLSTYGWWDQHHWFGYSGYVDEMYNNPKFYLRGVVSGPRIPLPKDSLFRLDKKEIIFWGEEGAFGTMVRLQKIKEELDTIGDTGFREKEHIDWYNYYNNFLDESGFRSSYPDVDSLTRSLGRNLSYFHGRNIENVRMSNIGDAYNMNGWGSAMTRTDVVDMYRNPTADPDIISYYTRPLYVAVKIRRKVLPTKSTPIADFFLINETNLKGNYNLMVTVTGPQNNAVFSKMFNNISVSGGEDFGQLLLEDISLPNATQPGHYTLNSYLLGPSGDTLTSGYDKYFVVNFGSSASVKRNIFVLESNNIIRNFLKSKEGFEVTELRDADKIDSGVIVVGDIDPGQISENAFAAIFRYVAAGGKLIVLQNADRFAEKINSFLRNRPAFYEGGGIVRWDGSGRLFVGKSIYLDGLPQSQGMSWEYQCFYKTTDSFGKNGMVSGLKINNANSETIVALGNQGRKDILTSLGKVKVGSGEVIYSTLNILPNLVNGDYSSVVAKRLLLNLIRY